MFSYVGWLGAGGVLVISIIRVAGYTTVPNWLVTAYSVPGSVKALLHDTTYSVCCPVL